MNTYEPSDRLCSLREVLSILSVSRSKLYELLESPDFPRPVKIGRRTHFSEREVQSWIASQLSRRIGQ